jgi:hypothetical protein
VLIIFLPTQDVDVINDEGKKHQETSELQYLAYICAPVLNDYIKQCLASVCSTDELACETNSAVLKFVGAHLDKLIDRDEHFGLEPFMCTSASAGRELQAHIVLTVEDYIVELVSAFNGPSMFCQELPDKRGCVKIQLASVHNRFRNDPVRSRDENGDGDYVDVRFRICVSDPNNGDKTMALPAQVYLHLGRLQQCSNEFCHLGANAPVTEADVPTTDMDLMPRKELDSAARICCEHQLWCAAIQIETCRHQRQGISRDDALLSPLTPLRTHLQHTDGSICNEHDEMLAYNLKMVSIMLVSLRSIRKGQLAGRVSSVMSTAYDAATPTQLTKLQSHVDCIRMLTMHKPAEFRSPDRVADGHIDLTECETRTQPLIIAGVCNVWLQLVRFYSCQAEWTLAENLFNDYTVYLNMIDSAEFSTHLAVIRLKIHRLLAASLLKSVSPLHLKNHRLPGSPVENVLEAIKLSYNKNGPFHVQTLEAVDVLKHFLDKGAYLKGCVDMLVKVVDLPTAKPTAKHIRSKHGQFSHMQVSSGEEALKLHHAGLYLFRVGDHANGHSFLQQGYTHLSHYYGTSHINTLLCACDLAHVSEQCGHYVEAIRCRTQLLGHRAVLGVIDPDIVLTSLRQQCFNYTSQNDYMEAYDAYNAAIEAYRAEYENPQNIVSSGGRWTRSTERRVQHSKSYLHLLKSYLHFLRVKYTKYGVDRDGMKETYIRAIDVSEKVTGPRCEETCKLKLSFIRTVLIEECEGYPPHSEGESLRATEASVERLFSELISAKTLSLLNGNQAHGSEVESLTKELHIFLRRHDVPTDTPMADGCESEVESVGPSILTTTERAAAAIAKDREKFARTHGTAQRNTKVGPTAGIICGVDIGCPVM